MEKISRDKIKEVVYDSVKKQMFDEKEFDRLILTKSNNGEDLLIYDELGFDSLDVTELILNLEYSFLGNNLKIDDDIFTNQITLGNIIDHIYNQQK